MDLNLTIFWIDTNLENEEEESFTVHEKSGQDEGLNPEVEPKERPAESSSPKVEVDNEDAVSFGEIEDVLGVSDKHSKKPPQGAGSGEDAEDLDGSGSEEDKKEEIIDAGLKISEVGVTSGAPNMFSQDEVKEETEVEKIDLKEENNKEPELTEGSVVGSVQQIQGTDDEFALPVEQTNLDGSRG